MFKPLVDIRARIYDMLQHDPTSQGIMTYNDGGERYAIANKPPVSQQDWWDKRAAVDAVLNDIGGVVTRVGDETIGEMWSLMDGKDVLNAADPRFGVNIERHIDQALRFDPFHVSGQHRSEGRPLEAAPTARPRHAAARWSRRPTPASSSSAQSTKPRRRTRTRPSRQASTIANWGDAAYSDYAVGFIVDMGSPNLKFICRTGFATRASAEDYPLSNRFDRKWDSLVIFDDVLIPWENVLFYRSTAWPRRISAPRCTVIRRFRSSRRTRSSSPT